MTNRERTLNILHFKPADRLPAVHFGYWAELLCEWAEAGKIPREILDGYGDGNARDEQLDRLIGWDFNWQCMVGARNGLLPPFEEKVLELLPDGSRRVQNRDGLIERVKPGKTSIPSEDCDGVTDQLLPTWVENGVNTMFPIEIGVWGDQFEAARNKFGGQVLGVGGMDKTALRRDRAAVDAEIARMKRMVSLGGFIPCPDHRLMPGTKFELVQYYAEEIKKIKI